MPWHELARVTVGRDDHGLLVVTDIADGERRILARPNPGDTDRDTLDHELLHTLLAVQAGAGVSPVMRRLAGPPGGDDITDADVAHEEATVLAMQRALAEVGG